MNDPATVTLPIPATSMYQRAPSEPTVISQGPLLILGVGNSVITPVGVMRPMLLR